MNFEDIRLFLKDHDVDEAFTMEAGSLLILTQAFVMAYDDGNVEGMKRLRVAMGEV